MFSSNKLANFNKPRTSINNFPLETKSTTESVTQPVQKVHLKSVPQPNSNNQSQLDNEKNCHKLEYRYNLWYSKRIDPRKLTTAQPYDQTLKLLANFGTVEHFWQIYSFLIRPNDLVGYFEFHLFREGIRPLWEDEANKNGGKWVLRLKKTVSSRCWESLVLAILGEQFFFHDEICGAVISTRQQEDFISIWNKTSNDQTIVNGIKDKLKQILNLPKNTVLTYKPHNERLKDHTAFKQTEQQQQQNQNSQQLPTSQQQNTQQPSSQPPQQLQNNNHFF